MNKNKVAVIIAILFTIVVLTGGWFYLQYIMDNYVDDTEENSTATIDTIGDHTHFYDDEYFDVSL
ncbi:MAG TPA: hypothetical protein VK142_00260 [Bacillota bacterium]|nr:hypothetical protein [Bacillota bacterium]